MVITFLLSISSLLLLKIQPRLSNLSIRVSINLLFIVLHNCLILFIVYASFDHLFAPVSKDLPQGVNEDFYTAYTKILDSLSPKAFKRNSFDSRPFPELILKINTVEELNLIPVLIERWRRRTLVFPVEPSKNLFELAYRFRVPDFAFGLLADKFKYGLAPRTIDMNRLLLMYSQEAPHLRSNTAAFSDVESWGEKMIMVYGLMPYYNCKPDQITANIIVESLANSLLGPAWSPKILKLTRELTDLGKVFSDEILDLLKKNKDIYDEKFKSRTATNE